MRQPLCPRHYVLFGCLALLPALGQAQSIGLEIPAPASPSPSRWQSGAYVSGNYALRPVPGLAAYAAQPYLRYQLGQPGRLRPFVQFTFAPYRVQAYGSQVPVYAPGGPELPANPGFAPLVGHYPGYGPAGYGSGLNGLGGSLGGWSVGIPVRVGGGSAVLNVGGSLLGGLLGGALR